MKHPFRWLSPARNPSAAPDERKMQSAFGAGMVAFSTIGEARWTGGDYASMAQQGYMRNPIVHRCVRLIAQAVGSAPLLLYDGARELDEHPVLALLARPNERQGRAEFFEALVGHLLIAGNAYIHGADADGRPGELHLLRPDRVSPRTDADGWVCGHTYQAGAGTRRFDMDEDGWLPVLHVALFHPLDDGAGLSPMRAALSAVDLHNAAGGWNKALLDNSARPSGALVYGGGHDANLTDEQFARLRTELEEGYTGAMQAGRPLLLEGGLDWKPMGHSPRDMDFMEARNGAARDIALAFGVPPMLLGIPGDNTYSNLAEANRAFARQTLTPLLGRVLDALIHWIGPRFGDDLRLTYDEDRIEGLSQDRDALWSRIGAADFLTDDEKREALGYSPRGAGGAR